MNRFRKYMARYAEMSVDGFCTGDENALFLPVRDRLSGCLTERLWRISASVIQRIFLEEAARNRILLCLVSDKPEDRQRVEDLKEELLKTLLISGDDLLQDRYPHLCELMDLTVRQFLSSLGEFRNRFDRDRALIEEHFFRGRRIGSITDIKAGMGDTHNHGRSTFIIGTDAGKLVYRPRDIMIDGWIREFFERFFPGITALPDVLVFEGYGYSEFIENVPADNEGDARIFYRNYGAFCAVSYILGSEDLHLENILSNGLCPVPIDLETMLTPRLVSEEISSRNISVWHRSVLTNGLFSLHLKGVECGALFSTREANMALPVINGEKKTVQGFKDAFLQGFEEGYRSFLHQKEDILEFINDMPSMKVRFLVRKTSIYANIISRSCSWDMIEDEDLAGKVREMFATGFRKRDLEEFSSVADSEAAAALEGNIPYFYTLSNTVDLYADGSLVCADYLQDSCVNNLIGNIASTSEDDLRYQFSIVSRAISRPLICKDKDVPGPLPSAVPPSPDRDRIISQAAEDILEDLMDEKMETPSGTPVWFTVNNSYSMPMSPSGYGLDKGYSGICLFLDAYIRHFSDHRENDTLIPLRDMLLTEVHKMLSYICDSSQMISERNCQCGLKDGIAGVLLAQELMMQGCHPPELNRRIRDICLQILFKMDFTYAKNALDSGISGLIAVLCRFDDLYGADGVPELVAKLSDLLISRREVAWNDRLLWKTGNDKQPDHSFETGQCGIGFGLSLAGKRTGNSSYTEAAEDAYAFVDEAFSNNGTGAPGVGFAMLSEESPLGVRNLERAVDTCMNAKPVYSDDILDGNCSDIYFLAEVGNMLGRPELIDAAGEKMAYIILRAKVSGGFNCLREGYERFFEPAFLSGAAGIGYCAIKCLERDRG